MPQKLSCKHFRQQEIVQSEYMVSNGNQKPVINLSQHSKPWMLEHRPDDVLMTEELIINCEMEKPSNKQNIACIVHGPDYIFTGMLLSITRQNCSIRQEAMCYTGSIVWPDDRDAIAWYHPQIKYRLAKVAPSYLQRMAELLANLQKGKRNKIEAQYTEEVVERIGL